MTAQVTNLLKNLNRHVLFFFLVLFTAPLDADEVISGSLGDERRRTSAGSVAINLVSNDEMSLSQIISANDAAPQDLSSHADPAVVFSNQDNNDTDATSVDQYFQQAFWCHQCSNELLQAESDQRNGDSAIKRVKESRSTGAQWIGTVISETGPPSFPENSTSYLAGHDNNGRLPQVVNIQTPDIISENVFYQIDRKTASVRSPTGPPISLEFNDAHRNHLAGPISSPTFVTPDSSTRIPTFSRGTHGMLRGTPVRVST